MHGRVLGLLFGLLLLAEYADANQWRSNGLDKANRIGQAEMRWFSLRVYRAELWADTAQWQGTAPLDSGPFALQIRYALPVSRDQLVSTSIDEIRRLRPGETRLNDWENAMRRVFVDVRSGDEITGVYYPGNGARFYLGNRSLGDINDPLFARAFFAIWLDPRTREPDIRRKLLAQDGAP